jgi:hypothetical protein
VLAKPLSFSLRCLAGADDPNGICLTLGPNDDDQTSRDWTDRDETFLLS